MNTSKGTLHVREPDGTHLVLADGIDITYACQFEGTTVRLPSNLPGGCTISLPHGYTPANALRRETARQRKNREAYEAQQRAAVRAAQEAGAVMVDDEAEDIGDAAIWALTQLTYGVWWALYGKDTQPPHPISTGPMPEEEEACCS